MTAHYTLNRLTSDNQHLLEEWLLAKWPDFVRQHMTFKQIRWAAARALPFKVTRNNVLNARNRLGLPPTTRNRGYPLHPDDLDKALTLTAKLQGHRRLGASPVSPPPLKATVSNGPRGLLSIDVIDGDDTRALIVTESVSLGEQIIKALRHHRSDLTFDLTMEVGGQTLRTVEPID